MRRIWEKRYTKFGFAARRRFLVICEKPQGVESNPPCSARIVKCNATQQFFEHSPHRTHHTQAAPSRYTTPEQNESSATNSTKVRSGHQRGARSTVLMVSAHHATLRCSKVTGIFDLPRSRSVAEAWPAATRCYNFRVVQGSAESRIPNGPGVWRP